MDRIVWKLKRKVVNVDSKQEWTQNGALWDTTGDGDLPPPSPPAASHQDIISPSLQLLILAQSFSVWKGEFHDIPCQTPF